MKEIKNMMGDGVAVDPTITAIIDKLNEETILSMKNAYFYTAIEGQSIRLQKKLSPILKNIEKKYNKRFTHENFTDISILLFSETLSMVSSTNAS